ncbi:MAG: hypothetical protein HRT44_04375 [Bdellovibrionales bacterium]|nr:hypothetical protein [Bdellovibrionales bacterium]NQZ18480.1 hypothetical protein [Bdellovibrionales bacterium]
MLKKDEAVNAGKGFSPEFEKMYSEKNKDLDYGAVDDMEELTVGRKQIIRFAKSGKLRSRFFRRRKK